MTGNKTIKTRDRINKSKKIITNTFKQPFNIHKQFNGTNIQRHFEKKNFFSMIFPKSSSRHWRVIHIRALRKLRYFSG